MKWPCIWLCISVEVILLQYDWNYGNKIDCWSVASRKGCVVYSNILLFFVERAVLYCFLSPCAFFFPFSCVTLMLIFVCFALVLQTRDCMPWPATTWREIQGFSRFLSDSIILKTALGFKCICKRSLTQHMYTQKMYLCVHITYFLVPLRSFFFGLLLLLPVMQMTYCPRRCLGFFGEQV